jgi:magnesium transporter
MAETSSDRPSRSDGERATGASDSTEVAAARRRGRRGGPPHLDRQAPAPAEAPTPIGAHGRGSVRILACVGDGTTTSTDLADLPELLRTASRVWVDLADPDDDQAARAADALGLHPLIAEDIRERDQRAKIETFDEGVVHVVLFALEYSGGATASEVDLVLGDGWLLTVHSGDLGREKTAPLRLGAEKALRKGADYLMYALCDALVDQYFPVLDRIGEEIDDLQDRVIEDAGEWTLQRLFTVKRELAELRRTTSPAREIFAQLTNREVEAIDPSHIVYFRDVYDHLIRVTDELDNDRDLVAGTLDIYVSIVNNDLSRIMKRLTGVTVILAGIGAVAGIFGMSEAGAAFQGAEAGGFWLVTAVVVALAVGAAVVLRRFDWI